MGSLPPQLGSLPCGRASRRATEVAAAETRPETTRAIYARVLGCLLGFLLVLQLAGLPQHGVRAAATIDAKTIALAGLKAAIGAPVTLCDHAGRPGHPGDPADGGTCEHCIFCHSVAAGITATPVMATDVVRVAISLAPDRPRADVAFARARHAGSATPRGPPPFG